MIGIEISVALRCHIVSSEGTHYFFLNRNNHHSSVCKTDQYSRLDGLIHRTSKITLQNFHIILFEQGFIC